jgi:hypothetical protein
MPIEGLSPALPSSTLMLNSVSVWGPRLVSPIGSSLIKLADRVYWIFPLIIASVIVATKYCHLWGRVADVLPEKEDNCVTPDEFKKLLLQNHPFTSKVIVIGDLDLSGDLFENTTLPLDLEVRGHLNLLGRKLKSLPPKLKVLGVLDLRDCKYLTILSEMLEVGVYLNLNGCTNLTFLPENEVVEGDMDISYTGLTSLPSWVTTLDPDRKGRIRTVTMVGTALSADITERPRQADAPDIEFFLESTERELEQLKQAIDQNMLRIEQNSLRIAQMGQLLEIIGMPQPDQSQQIEQWMIQGWLAELIDILPPEQRQEIEQQMTQERLAELIEMLHQERLQSEQRERLFNNQFRNIFFATM